MRRLSLYKSLCTLSLLAGAAGAAYAAPAGLGGPQSPDQHLSGRDLPAVLAGLASQQTTRRLGDGCWVRFYADRDFRGRSVTVVGPVDLARLDVGGSTWGDWDSAVVGPQATVTTFGQEGYRNPSATMRPGQRAPDLQRGREGPLAQFRSAKVDCVA